MTDNVTPMTPPKVPTNSAKVKGCPICKNPPHDAFTPFCGKRCSEVDLSRWLNGVYAIPGQDGEAVVPANDTDDELDY